MGGDRLCLGLVWHELGCGHVHSLLEQIRGSGSPTSWSITRRPPNAVLTSTIPGGSVFTSPISAARSQPSTSRSAASARRPRPFFPGPRRRRASPLFAPYIDRSPRSPPHPATAASTGTSPSPHHDRHAGRPRELVHHRGDAAARRVAHRVQRRAGCFEQRVGGGPQRAGVRLDVGVQAELAAREHDRRPVRADLAGDQDPVAGPQRALARARRAGSRRPTPARADVHPVGVPALDDLRVTGRDPHAGERLVAAAIASTSARSTSAVQALLEDQREAQRQRTRPGHREVVDRAVDARARRSSRPGSAAA